MSYTASISRSRLADIVAGSFLATGEFHEEIGSTNDRAVAAAASGELQPPAIVLAQHQSSGRGRGGNTWWSQPGALLFTLMVLPRELGVQDRHLPRLSLSVGLAIADSLEPHLPATNVGLKWPNDVFLNDRKVAGILIESVPTIAGCYAIGIGINVNNSYRNAPPELRETAIAMVDCSPNGPLEAGRVLNGLLENLPQILARSDVSAEEFQHRWQDRCVLSGRTIELQHANQVIKGICRGINADGAILIESADTGTPAPFYSGSILSY